MNYLISSKCFIDGLTTDQEKMCRVLKGYHGLHQYADEFWFQHLLQYAKFDLLVDEDQIEQIVDKMRAFWKAEPGSGGESLHLDSKIPSDWIQTELEVLNSLPQAQSMVLDILKFRQYLSQEKYSHQTPNSKFATVSKVPGKSVITAFY
jgi:hypothetical protein